jgi:hypothetical protein
MKIIIFLFLFSLSTITPVQAKGEGFRGLDLLRICESPEDTSPKYLCMAYVSGMRDMYEIFSMFNTYLEEFDMPGQFTANWNGTMKGCTRGITNEQIVRVLIKWMNENPEKLHKLIVMQFPEIMNKAFPCKE